jgi:hypothetical protein
MVSVADGMTQLRKHRVSGLCEQDDAVKAVCEESPVDEPGTSKPKAQVDSSPSFPVRVERNVSPQPLANGDTLLSTVHTLPRSPAPPHLAPVDAAAEIAALPAVSLGASMPLSIEALSSVHAELAPFAPVLARESLDGALLAAMRPATAVKVLKEDIGVPEHLAHRLVIATRNA